MVLWLRQGLTGKTCVTLPAEDLVDLGVDRYAANRALNQLEIVGLVKVERGKGRKPRVTILDGLLDGPGGRQSSNQEQPRNDLTSTKNEL